MMTNSSKPGPLPLAERKLSSRRSTGATSSLTDEELMQRYRDEGDQSTFTELVRRYQPGLTGFLRRFVRDAAAAEDLFQMTFEHLHDRRRDYEAGRPLRPWLYSIATHLAIDWLRNAARHPAVSLDRPLDNHDADRPPRALVDLLPNRIPTPSLLAEGHESGDWTRHAVDALPEHLRATLLLIYYQGLKYTEAAEMLGIPVGTVKSRVHQALQRLRHVWPRESSPGADVDEPVRTR
jgi:RNA polymerase sigma-70 factor (ECF subfamily)